MTFKDLQKVIGSQPGQGLDQLQRLRDKPFWIWDKPRHKASDRVNKGECCFNHIISMPKKNGIEYTLFDYEKLLYKALFEPGFLNNSPKLRSDDPNNILYKFKEKHLYIKKSTGLGISTFFLRLMAWLCLYNDDYKNSQMVIVTGPNIDLAIKLIRRMKAMFAEKLGVIFDSKETVLELNGCSIQAYPSNHIDSYRSLDNPKFLFLDELDFIPKFQQDEVRAVSERYIAKSDPFIVLVSTPNAPGSLFERIEKEPAETCLYKKFFLDYLWGLGKIYTQEEIDKAKLIPVISKGISAAILRSNRQCL